MPIQFPDTSVNNNVSFFLDFEGPTRSQETVYDPDLLVFRDKTDNTTVSVANNGAEYLQITNGDRLYTGEAGYLSTTYDSALSLGTGAYTIEIIMYIPSSRTDSEEGVLSVGATAGANNWELVIDALKRPIFKFGTASTSGPPTAALTADTLQHIAIVRTGTGANESTVYLNGTSVKTFTDATDYNYTDGLYVGSGRDGAGFTQAYVKNVRVSTEAKYTANFTAPSTLSYVAIGDTYRYLNKTYKWDGVKWFDRSKFNANIPGEYQNYATYTASSNTTTIDVSAANFVEVDLVGGQDTEFVFANEALEQNLLMKVNQGDLSVPYSLETASYDNVEAALDSFNTTFFFSSFTWSDDGKYLYIPQNDARTLARVVPLSGTPWDVESGFGLSENGTFASYNWVALDLSPTGEYFAASRTYQYASYISLPTPYSLSSMSFTTITGVPVSYGVSFIKNGNAALYLGSDGIIREYAMTTPYNTTTTQTTLVDSFDLGFSASGLRLNGDESKIYVVHDGKVKSYDLNQNSTIGSLNLSSEYIYDPGVAATHLDLKSDGTKMYITVNSPSKVIRQYDIQGELDKPTISWPSNVTWSTGSAPTISSTTLIEFNKYNGIWHGNVISDNL